MSLFLFHSLDETKMEIVIVQNTIVQRIKGKIKNCTKNKGKANQKKLRKEQRGKHNCT